MISYPILLLVLLLMLLSAININASLQHKQCIRVLPYIIGAVGIFGLIGSFVRLIDLSIRFQWWWFLAFAGVGLLVIGVFSFLTRKKISLILGTFNILLIPFVWWYGSKLNTTVSYDWMYNITDAVRDFFI